MLILLDCSNDVLCFQRMDLGECPKIHDLALRADYEKASQSKDYYYDIDVSRQFCVILSSALFVLQS